MIQTFKDRETEEIYDNEPSKRSRRRLPEELWEKAQTKLDMMDAAEVLDDLKAPPGNRLEPLSGDRKGQHSIRINSQYRICFRWEASGPVDVEVTDYH